MDVDVDAANVVHEGSCHCGAVRIEVRAPRAFVAYDCNCSMCTRTGFIHLIVAASALRVVQGREALTNYTFGTHTAQHYFCAVCGCRPFYVPRSNPDGFSVNVRCLDRATLGDVEVRPFDGQNWEAAPSLAHLSRAPG